MTFIASKALGILVVLAAIGVIVLLWIQCQHGCVASVPKKVITTPTPVVAFGTNELHIISPLRGISVDSPLTITGEAIPDWYIGGAFTIRLLDEKGIGLAYAQAKPTTTTPVNGFIPFSATFAFFPHTQQGTLIFEKNLGSGLPDFPTTVAMPISFARVTPETPTIAPEPSNTATPAPDATVTPAQTGVLQGNVTIGPICPTEQSGAACRPSIKMYAERVISVYKEDKTTLVIKIVPGPDGSFAQELPPGTYYVSMIPQIMGSITGVPTTVTVHAGTTVNLSIAVDTGINTATNTINDETSSSDGF